MIFKSTPDQEVKLVMFEKTEMPESNMQKVNGKTEFVKTGKMVEMTTYTFRDGFGEKLIVLSSNNDYRSLEGKIVNVELDIKFNDFQKKTQTKLAKCTEVKK